MEESDGEVRMLISNVAQNPSGTLIAADDYHQMLTRQLGGTYFSKNGEVAVNSPESVRALELMKRFRDEEITLNNVPTSGAVKE